MSLEPLFGRARKLRIKTYDAEWYPSWHPRALETRVVGVYDGQSYHACYSWAEFLERELIPENRGVTYYGHFGGRFDGVFLLDAVRALPGVRVELAMQSSYAVRITIIRGRDVWEFRDSAFIFRMALRKVAEALGMKKGECAFDAPLSELIPYNRLDCIILYVAITRAAEAIAALGGQLQATLASTALDLFRRRYLKAPIVTQELLNETLRPAFVAARVERLRERHSHGSCRDINSSFPFSATLPLPGDLMRIGKDLRNLAIADTTVHVPEMYFPPLPMRVKGRIYFPTGTWRGMYTREDLNLLEAFGGSIQEIHQSWHFHAVTDFRDFIDDLYQRRVGVTDPFFRLFYKILMNSLIGKLGERPEKWTIFFRPPFTSCPHGGEHMIDGKSSCIRRFPLAPDIIAVREIKMPPHTHLPVPIWTTSRSRALIAEAAVREMDLLAYLDTDCLQGSGPLTSSNRLGEMKLEYEYDEAVFVAPKAYAIRYKAGTFECSSCGRWGIGACSKHPEAPQKDSKFVAKGFSRIKSWDEFERFRAGFALEQERFRSVRASVAKGGIGEDVIRKALGHVCDECGHFRQDGCPDHPSAARIVYPHERPKRKPEGDDSRAWRHDELALPWRAPSSR